MEKRRTSYLVGLVCVLAVLGLTRPAVATPYFLLETEEEWNQALSSGHVEGVTPPEWADYMLQWSVYREEGEPYPTHEFLPPELYVYGGGGGGGLDPEDAGLVMVWGDGTTPDGSYSSAWKYEYGLDPNLTNCTITVTVTPPPWINVVSFGMQDAAGNIRAWYWNVGAGGPLLPGVPTTITIIASQPNINATTPVASAFANNPLFNITQVLSFIFDENSNWVGGIGIPAPGTGLIGSWNYWHNVSVLPFQNFIKWAQPPTYSDESQYPDCFWGWDELSIWEGPHFVADDWPCNDDRPITDIHWWGSYQGWEGPEPPLWGPQMFHIAIWTDVPVGPGNPYPWSHPGQLIYEWWVSRAELFERQDGCDFYPPMVGPDTCFRYDFIIPRDQWFYQKPHENNVYWLSIAASYPTGIPQNPWGWKTRLPHWNDDAVRIFDPLMPAAGAAFGAGEPIETQHGSWDMSFVLTTNREEPMPSEPKYEQPPEPIDPPNVFLGWNEESLWDPQLGPGSIAADDWVCSSPDPITKIRWWGSFIGWNYAYPPSTVPNHFHIHIWTDVPASVDGFSHPGRVLHEIICYNFTYQWVGWDYNPATGEYESCFLFEQTLTPEEYFYQPTVNGIYWISIAACYQPNPPPSDYLWGWKTRPRDPASPAPDDAVRMWDPRAPVVGSTWGSGEPIFWPTPEDSWDLAFELISEPAGGDVTKWTQDPDLTTNGIDVNASASPTVEPPQFILADDFPCTKTSRLTKIEVWGSWYLDQYPMGPPPDDVIFTLSIHADIPAQPPEIPYSQPGQMLWTRTFQPGQFSVSMYAQQIEEGWLNPPSNYIFPADWTCWLYTFNIPLAEAFQQTGTPTVPKVYWLDVQARPQDPEAEALFGWKTSYTHWNDDAVWGKGVEPYPGPWYELRYPPGHQHAGESMDLAFRISDPSAQKYQQLPDLSTNGMDVNDTYRDAQPGQQYLLADDFECNVTGPLTHIDIFGSWLDDHIPYSEWPQGVQFTLSIHEDIPVGDPRNPYTYSIPGETLWLRTWAPGTFGAVVWATIPNGEGWLDPPTDYTWPADWTCWMYSFDIPAAEAFIQQGTPENPIIYWLDVQAISQDTNATFGWKTSLMHWNDDAVWANTVEPVPVVGPWNELLYPPGHEMYGQSIDLAFWIFGQTQQPPYTKWSQPPEPYTPDDGYNGWNEPSVYNWYQIVADDWPCTTEYPVTDLHWWGSFVGWPYQVVPQLPDRFHIGIWTDVPAAGGDPSHPGVMLWEVWCDNFTYEFVGWDWDPREPTGGLGNPPEACFRFDQVLNRHEWFFQDPGENIYWISIAAVYDSGTYPDYPWGWKTRPHLFMDDGVTIYDPVAPVAGAEYVSGAPIEYPAGISWDLAFTLTTLDCDLLGDTNMDGLINGLDIQCFVHCLIDGFPACSAVCNCACADMDQDGFLTLADIGPFVTALLGP